MIYLISGFDENTFNTLKAAVPAYTHNFKSITSLVEHLGRNGANDLHSLVVMAEGSSLTDNVLSSLRVTVTNINPQVNTLFICKNQEELERVKGRVLDQFSNAKFHVITAAVTMNLFRSLADLVMSSEEEVAPDEETAQTITASGKSVNIGYFDLTLGGLGFFLVTSLAKNLTKNVQSVAYHETAFSAGKVRRYLGESSDSSAWSSFAETGKFDYRKGLSYSSNMFLYPATPDIKNPIDLYVKSLNTLAVNFVDLGRDISKADPKLLSLFDELWVLIDPDSVSDIEGRNVSKLAKVIVCDYDEYSEYRESVGDWRSLEDSIVARLDNVAVTVMRKAKHTKTTLSDIPDFSVECGKLLNPLRERVVALCV